LNQFFQAFAMINVKILLIINLTIIFFLALRRGWQAIGQMKFKRMAVKHGQQVSDYLQEILQNPQAVITCRPWERKYVYALMLSDAATEPGDFHAAFDNMGFTAVVMKKVSRKNDLAGLHDLSVIRSPLAEAMLYQKLLSQSGEIAYRVAFALTRLTLDEAQQNLILRALLQTKINQNRIIELVDFLKPPLEMCLHLLDVGENERGRIILLRYLESRTDLHTIPLERIEPYLEDSLEVAISAVLVIGNMPQEKALQRLIAAYENNSSWEIRAIIAKVMCHFPGQDSIRLLKQMCSDESWWVKFNALASLSKMGQEGLDAILDTALETNNTEAAAMAYQLLNADRKVHDTLLALNNHTEADNAG